MTTPCILLIEDHKDFREAVRHFLELHHIHAHIVEASTGEEGVFLALRRKPKIVITDFALGEMNGVQAARQIKTYFPQCNIILLTMYDPQEIMHRDGDGAIKSFISKSNLYEELIPAIKKILSSSNRNKSKSRSSKLLST